MNRVNLLFNKVSGQKTAVGTFIDEGYGSESNSSLIINLALFFWVCGLLYAWEFSQVGRLKEVLTEKRNSVAALKKQVEQLEGNSDKAKEAQRRIDGLKQRKQLLKKLSKSRVDALKSLDHLQTIIPERVWLRKLVYLQGKLTFEGTAISDEDLNLFMDRLEQGGFFVDVNPVNVAEAGAGKGKNFTLTCSLGNI